MEPDGCSWIMLENVSVSTVGVALPIVILLIMLVCKGYFTACEYAILDFNEQRLKNLAEKSKSARIVLSIRENFSKVMMAFSLIRALMMVLIILYSTLTFFPMLVDNSDVIFKHLFGERNNFSHLIALPISFLIYVLLSVYIVTVTTEAIPKNIVQKNAEQFALKNAMVIRGALGFIKPFTEVVYFTANGLLRLFGVAVSNDKDKVTEEEILMMVEAGNETGVLEKSQQEMINNIFEFGDRSVSDVMTHRTDISATEINASVSDVVNIAISTGFSRIPVYEGSIDKIVGILNVKDMLCLIGSQSTESFEIRRIMRDCCYVPESAACDDIFKELTSRHIGMGVVLDEYGGTAGIVTTEDLVEAIMGNIQDEYDNETEDIVKISENVYTVDGTAEPYHTLESIGIEIPEDDDFDTVSGFVISLLDGRIPEKNEKPIVKWRNVEFAVLVTEDMVIKRLKVTITPEVTVENSEEDIEKE